MACYHPLATWRAKTPNPSGKYPVTFDFNLADTSQPVPTRCGRCIGCRLDWARSWGIRMMHEYQTTEKNNPGTTFFATFTYNEANLPWSDQSGTMTLRPEDFTLFMKRLRKNQDRDRQARGLEPVTIRYFQGGEYGENTERPHHHAIFYNLDLPDLRRLSPARTPDARALYTSQLLEETWGKGNVAVGRNVSLTAARYVAAYVTKKYWSHDQADRERHYHGRVPEFHTMSRRPGIGAEFWKQHHQDLTRLKAVAIQGTDRPLPLPRFYIDRWEADDDDAVAAFKAELQLAITSKTGKQLIATETTKHALANRHRREPTP